MRPQLTLGKSRIETLSDGVFAIALTLLVLKLEVPPVMHHSSNEQMLRMLLELGPAFVAYAATFLIAGGFWFLHHISLHFIRHVDAVLVWINLFFLMLVALLPFSAGLIGHLLLHPVSQLFYYGNQLAIAFVLSIQWFYAKLTGLVDSTDERSTRCLTLRIGATVAAFATCLLVAVVFPHWSWVPLPLILGGELIYEVRS